MTSLTTKKAHTAYEEVMAEEEVVVRTALVIFKRAYVSSTLGKFNMETYVSTTDQSSSRWDRTMVIILLISQVQGKALDIVRWSPHTPAVIGQSVTMACVFNNSATCTWTRSNKGESQKVKPPGNGYSYNGYKEKKEPETTDCSLTIEAVKKEDFAMWFCTGFLGTSTTGRHSSWMYITQQLAPQSPVIQFNNKTVQSIELPSSHPLTHMVCRSESGNPPPSLHWEVNGTVYKGKLNTTPADFTLYTVELRWDGGTQWQMLDNVSEVICKAIHPGFNNTEVATVKLRRQYAPRTVKILAEGFNNDNITLARETKVTLSCISDGYPQPTNYTWEVWSEKENQWKLYIYNGQNITVTTKQLGKYRCKASNRLNQHSPTTSVNQLIVTEIMKESSDEAGGFGLIVGVGGGIIFVAVAIIVILTVAHVKLRERLRRVEMGSKCPSEASVAQLHRNTDPPAATASPTTDVTPPDTDADIATYGNVGWTNAEPNVYWKAMSIYE